MSGSICSICYEDARLFCGDLQFISPCGHVYHELCLQQWIEFCPAGKKPTCPLCKGSCTVRDVHRLYLQPAGSNSSQSQSSPSRNPETAGNEPKQVDNDPALRKLEIQLAAAKAALQSRNEHLKELDSQVVANLQRAEKAEAAYSTADRKLAQCKQDLARVQEELKCCSNERAMLQEKNQAMVKDLVAHKLIEDTDLGEEEILRLVNLGNVSNKNVIIGTLTKSLILRNKSYKELMARCNELGMGESRALRKSEKTIEHLKKMKVRVLELEKLLEEKDNASLRGLNRGNSKSLGDDVLSAQRPFSQAGAKRINAPRTPPSDQLDLHVISRVGLLEVQLPKIVRERGQIGVEHAQPACPKNVNTSEENPHSRKRGRSVSATGLDHGEDNAASKSDSSYWIIKSKHLLQKIELLNRNRHRSSQEVIGEHPVLAPNDIVQLPLPRPAPKSLRIEKSSPTIASSATCRDQSVLNPFKVERETGTQGCTVTSENSGHMNLSVEPPVNSYGAFSKRPSTDRPSTSSSSFILSGADGRGGRVTVLRPPSLTLGGVPVSAPQRMKRPRTSGAGFRGTQGSLQIEHFFGRAKS